VREGDSAVTAAAGEETESPATRADVEESQGVQAPSHVAPVEPQTTANGEEPLATLGPDTQETSLSPDHLGDDANAQERSRGGTASPTDTTDADSGAGAALGTQVDLVDGGRVASAHAGGLPAHAADAAGAEAEPDADAALLAERGSSQLARGGADVDPEADSLDDDSERQVSRLDAGGDTAVLDLSTGLAEAPLEPADAVDDFEEQLRDPDAVVRGDDKIDIGGVACGSADEGAVETPGGDLPCPLQEPADAVAAPAARVRPTADRRRAFDPEALARPAVVSAPALDDAAYLVWNRALAQYCLFGDEVDELLYLTVTPTILAAALSEVQPGRLLPEDAEAAFVRSVAAVYRGRVLEHRQRLRILRRCGPEGLPDCIAFLAASVLAAYQMRSDEEAAATAYYSRLAELLTCDLAGGHPRGFDPDEFEALWHFLDRWLRTEKGRRLALPGPEVGLRRFVALPLTHVPLRRVDIERLPEFFAWVGYEPGARIARTKLDQDLVSWSLGRTPFTSAGMAALADERRPAVLSQIAHELESWDGAHTDSLGRRSGRVEILLDVVQRRPELFYLPRRPAAFPQVFDDGAHAFEASDEGWYDPVPLGSEDGRALSDGFEWQVIAGRLRLVLRRPGAHAIALPASHEYTGYLSHRALQLGAPAAALCRETLAQAASEYLSAISQQRCITINYPGLPEGWRLFTGIKPQRQGETPPAGLEALAVEAAVDLIPAGGLRLGSRWAWVLGAPPRLIVAGLDVGERVTIDGEPVAVADDGTLAGNGALARPGTHIIEAAGLRRRVEITEPEVPSQPWTPPPARTVLALPRGSWTLVGAVPGEVALPVFRSPTGAVVSSVFPVVWAVESGAGPGARVLCLSVPAPPPSRVMRFAPYGPGGRSLQWASAIYNAAIRRPRMTTLDGQPCRLGDCTVWAEYAQAARDIKRRFRRARR
jgi:hypothetical protein